MCRTSFVAFLYHLWMTVLKRSLGNQLQFCHECLCGALAACSDAFAGVGMVWSAMDWNYVDTTQSCKVKKGYWSLGHILISYPWSTRSCKLKGSPCIISTTPSYSTRQVAIQSGSVESGNINRKLYWLVSSHVMRCWYRRWKNRALLLLGGGPTLYPTVLPFDYN